MSSSLEAVTDNLKTWQFVYMEVSMLLPCAFTCVLFWYYGFPLITLICILLICYLIVPLAYILHDKICTHNTRIGSSFANIFFDKKKQLMHGLVWFFVAGAIMFAILYFSLTYLHYWAFHRINFFYMPKTEVITISVLMVLLDPFLEEFFWRLFLQSAFTGGITYSDPKEPIIWYIALHYGLLYSFIFAVMTVHWWYGFIAAIPFVFISRKFSYVRSTGLLAAVIAHTGLNIGFVVAFNLWFWNKWPIAGPHNTEITNY